MRKWTFYVKNVSINSKFARLFKQITRFVTVKFGIYMMQTKAKKPLNAIKTLPKYIMTTVNLVVRQKKNTENAKTPQ